MAAIAAPVSTLNTATPAPGSRTPSLTLTTALAPLAWGTTYLVTAEWLPPDRPLLAGAIRALPAGLAVLAITRTLPHGIWWWRAAVLGTLNIGAFFALLFVAAYRLPGGVAATLGAVQPLLVCLLAFLLLGERPTRRRLGWAVAGVAGVGLMVLRGHLAFDPVGILAGLGGTAVMATGIVLTKRWGRPVGLLTFTGWQLTAGGLLLAPPALLIEGFPSRLGVSALAGYAWLAVVGTLVAYALWFRGVQRLPVAAVSFLPMLSPAVAAVLGWVVLGQSLTAVQSAGFALALVSVVAGQVTPAPRHKQARHRCGMTFRHLFLKDRRNTNSPETDAVVGVRRLWWRCSRAAVVRCDEGAMKQPIVSHPLPGPRPEPNVNPVQGRATVRAVASETGLSIATVSRVLNGQTNVAPATQQRVREVMDRLGARAPLPRRRPPAARPRPPVFVRCPYLLTDYFGHIVSSIAETLALHGQQMVLDAGDSGIGSKVLRGLPDRHDTSGAVLILPPEPIEDLESVTARDYPLVVVDPRIAVPRGTVAISAAHFSAARSVTRHLVGLGHHRIGVICGPPYWLARDDRVAGHLAALSEAGVLGNPDLMRHGEPKAETGVTAGGELLDLPERPTAVVCFNDKVAVGVLQAAAVRGLRVPQDLSVTGFDDIDVSRATTPKLTTVRQPLQEMGRVAVTMLMRRLEGHALEALSIELATELIVRGSTGMAPPPPSPARKA